MESCVDQNYKQAEQVMTGILGCTDKISLEKEKGKVTNVKKCE